MPRIPRTFYILTFNSQIQNFILEYQKNHKLCIHNFLFTYLELSNHTFKRPSIALSSKLLIKIFALKCFLKNKSYIENSKSYIQNCQIIYTKLQIIHTKLSNHITKLQIIYTTLSNHIYKLQITYTKLSNHIYKTWNYICKTFE